MGVQASEKAGAEGECIAPSVPLLPLKRPNESRE